MNTIRWLIFCAVLGCLLAPVSDPAFAGTAGKSSPSLPAGPERGKVKVSSVAVDDGATKVTLYHTANGQKEVFVVDDLTQITINGKSGTVKDIKGGLYVADYVARDESSLDVLTLSTADPSPAK